MHELQPVVSIRLKDLKDLARFAASISLSGISAYILHFYDKGKARHIYGIFTRYRDYYKLYGLPIFYYVELENEVNGNYIIMKMSEKETIEFSDGTRRGYICIPIIHLSQKPIFIGESD
ncbi:MAG: cren protein [Thermoprotei archaeon]|nr:MAG: cren protein [Thermofilum sp. ex4484_79]RLE61300.1 MAG: cren protein [Thermoprotei archaeon]